MTDCPNRRFTREKYGENEECSLRIVNMGTPTKEGFYWLLRDDQPPTIVKIHGFDISYPRIAWPGNDRESDLDSVAGTWVGPIEPPYNKMILHLRAQHGLSFRQNAGGGEFESAQFGRCQVYLQSDKDDYVKLSKWIAEQRRASAEVSL